MSSDRAPFVAIRTDVRKDERFSVLGDVCGYSRHEALGRMVDLWAWCADRKLADAPDGCRGYAVSESVVVRFLGSRGVEGILGGGVDEFALGERWGDRLIYLRGTESSVARQRGQRISAKSGGDTRVQNATRSGGKFVSQSTIDQPDTSGSPAVAPAGDQPAPAKDHRPQTIDQISGDPPLACARSQGVVPVVGAGMVASDLELRKAARAMLWREFAELRQTTAAAIGEECRPLLAHDPGERELALRLAEVGPEGLETAIANARHAMAVVAAECVRDRELKWLTGAMFGERAWRRAVASTVSEAKRPRGAHRARDAPTARSPTVGRVEPMKPNDYQEGDEQF